VALVLLVNSFQPLFVLLFGILLTLVFPHISQESMLKKHLVQKVLGIALIVAGSCLIGA
jgi:hypothetical protein